MTRNDQLYEQIKDLLEANLAPMRADILSMKKSINGNGQPGLVQRVESLESWKWRVIGMAGMVTFFITFFGEQIKMMIFRR